MSKKPEVAVIRGGNQKAERLSAVSRFKEYFDQKYYLLQLPQEEAQSISNAAEHYLVQGWKRGLDPSERFSTTGYLDRYADVRAARINPLEHYARFGVYEGRIVSRARGVSEGQSAITRRLTADNETQNASASKDFTTSGGKIPLRLSDFPIPAEFESLDPNLSAALLSETGLVQKDEYLAKNPDLRGSDIDPLIHYVKWGFREKRKIHVLFDQDYYLRQVNPPPRQDVPPIIHYLLVGARLGYQPHPVFDANEYSRQQGLDLTHTNPLIHYSLTGGVFARGSLRLFDEQFYLQNYPFAAQYSGGAVAHFLECGVFEGKRPCSFFNTNYYYATHLNNDRSINAFLHYLDSGKEAGLATELSSDVPTVTREIAHFSNPGPQFEELDPEIAAGRAKNARVFAFYLPQFHAIPENDAWWGKGFTEWRNLARGVPRFAGHYQPRIPRDLGFYDLSAKEPLRNQVQLALQMGISGFAFYFYWFNTHRVLETPLNNFLADASLQMPFLLIFANENWTRRWDGMESEVLISQRHDANDDRALIDCFQEHFADARYVRIGDQPLLVIYRADIIPDCKNTLARWRNLFAERHGEKPLFFMAQTFACSDPREYGFDGAIEFPPHKIGNTTQPINRDLKLLDFDYTGDVRSYDDAVEVSLSELAPPFPLIKTVFPSWDNSARRQLTSTVYHGSTPEAFGRWLNGAINFAQKHPVGDQSIVFVNAWNEWCEGAYLEPDVHYGGAYLNALARTVTSVPASLQSSKYKVLLIGHDAFPAGAQLILLNVARTLTKRFGLEVQIALLEGGALAQAFSEVAPTRVVPSHAFEGYVSEMKKAGFEHAVTNTVATGGAASLLKSAGFAVVSLVHELPNLISSYGLEPNAEILRSQADTVVFPTAFVREAFEVTYGEIEGRTVELPQGLYRTNVRDRAAGSAIREGLGLRPDHRIVINVGYGDLRKGVDIFVQTARNMQALHPDMQFVWLGDLHPDVKRWLPRQACTNMHFVGHHDDVGAWLNAADVFFLTSREDPFPSVVIEALQVGLPVVAFRGNGGFTDLLSGEPKLGRLIPEQDAPATLLALDEESRAANIASNVSYRIELASRFDHVDYTFDLLKLFWPGLRKVTAVVPNYNYARYLPGRLRSIFEQSYPLYELIVLDDSSDDDSLAVIRTQLANAGREATVVTSSQNSGSVFHQWQRAGALARGELLWIAEADDLAAPGLIEALTEPHTQIDDCVFAYSDSRAVNESGELIYRSYKNYAEQVQPGIMNTSRVFSAREYAALGLGVANLVLNASAVLWNRARAAQALAAAATDLREVKLVGDWLVYLAACGEGGHVAYVDQPLNVHRLHPTSVTNSADTARHMAEIEIAQKKAAALVGRKRSLLAAQKSYRARTEAWLQRKTRS